MSLGYKPVPVYLEDEKEHRRQLARTVNLAQAGKLNAMLDVTLGASVTSTTVTDARISALSFIQWMPLTASALTAFPNLRVSSQTKGSAVLSHASNAATDQNFRLLIIG